MSSRQRIMMASAGAAILALAVILVLRPGSGPERLKPPDSAPIAQPSESATPLAEGGAQPDRDPLLRPGRIVDVVVTKGEIVRFRVRADSDDEVHVHGYDVTKTLPAGEAVSVRFRADIDGVFEIELHHGAEQIGRLRVSP